MYLGGGYPIRLLHVSAFYLALEGLEQICFEQVAAEQVKGRLAQGEHRRFSGTLPICSDQLVKSRVQTARCGTALTARYGIHSRLPLGSSRYTQIKQH
jgi:hypothetical protein